MTEQSTCSLEAVHANPSVWLDYEKASPTKEETCHWSLLNWLTEQIPVGWSLKTYRACLAVATKEAILPNSYRCYVDGKSPLHQEAGEKVELLQMPTTATQWHGECLTLNIPEFPNFQGQSRNAGDVSSLSDILEVGNIPPRYYLTKKCSEGILRRAERRGKDLPVVLKEALIKQTQLE